MFLSHIFSYKNCLFLSCTYLLRSYVSVVFLYVSCEINILFPFLFCFLWLFFHSLLFLKYIFKKTFYTIKLIFFSLWFLLLTVDWRTHLFQKVWLNIQFYFYLDFSMVWSVRSSFLIVKCFYDIFYGQMKVVISYQNDVTFSMVSQNWAICRPLLKDKDDDKWLLLCYFL